MNAPVTTPLLVPSTSHFFHLPFYQQLYYPLYPLLLELTLHLMLFERLLLEAVVGGQW